MVASSNLLLLLLVVFCSCGGSSDTVDSQFLNVPVSQFIDSIKFTIDAVEQVASIVSGFGTNFGEFRLSNAIADCIDLLDLTAEELSWTLSVSSDHNSNQDNNNNGTGYLSSDLRTWLTGALANQDTCIDGFDGTNSFIIKSAIAGGLNQISSLILQSLQQVHDTPPPTSPSRQWNPAWFSARELQTGWGSVDAVVAKDGSGDYDKIMDAIASAPLLSTRRFVIYVKKGVYKEYVEINKHQWNIMIVGDGMDASIISGNRSFKGGYTTFRSATFSVNGKGFIARDITFENTAGAEMEQAVAFRSDSDLSVLYRCGIKGFQDTLYAHSSRQFYRECRISGTVDFIFGDGTVVFQSCQIVARKGKPNQKNAITAQGRKHPCNTTGFSIQFSNISVETELLVDNHTQTYLGRPWRLYSRTMIMQSYIGPGIRAEGWLEWKGDLGLNTLWYGEYMNYGEGAGVGNRVKWPGFHLVKDPSHARNFTVAEFILGDYWLPDTDIKYTAGLSV
ncbi:pectinesterase/pectinesterase inhibitor PPE8B-like [Impatiens glandulifera]|uniref:pectinesterase/pectinesterase inhibitor PPE8B-like n=1 Tax=Impatiens glandulifera TaxID=253017 RepID=UPI001FB084B9|nr:pectinesterase/pectinesterase inhibitor PPE8B-like [Impatiens glandulifera]